MTKPERLDLSDPRISGAVADLQRRISTHYPRASFTTLRGDDPEGIYLRVAVDVDDPEQVLDTVMDQLLELGDEEVPVYVIPVQPLNGVERVLGRPDSSTAVDPERLAHLESLAAIVYRFIEAHYDPNYAAVAAELRALGYAVRDDIPEP